MAGIMCDLSKAFDVISHKLILNKLHCYGIRDVAHRLFKSFLSDRRQVVKLSAGDGTLVSDTGHVNIGIPQGSALGNSMFLVFVNDLPSAITTGLPVLFADDTTVIVSARTYEQLSEKIHNTCGQLQHWFTTNGLLLNLAKSNVMVFSGRHVALPPCIYDVPMPLCSECRFLGFMLDSNLNWKCHVDKLCDKLGSAVFVLRKLKPLISKVSLRSVYFAMFHSLMSYGTLMWGNSTDANRVLILQKRALRTMAGVKTRHSCRGIFVENRIMTHYSLYLFEVLMFVRSNFSSFTKVDVANKVIRSTGRLRTVPRRMALAGKNPRVIGPTFYERLPQELKNETSNEKFKSRLRNFLLENPLYSINEFYDITN
jgi:hypothetical protein